MSLLIADLPLAVLAHQFTFFNIGIILPISAAFAAVGTVVARSQLRNPVGWLLLAFGLLTALCSDAGMYSVLRYRLAYAGLPLGPLATFLAPSYVPLLILLPLPIALFPDGRMRSTFGRATLGLYVLLSALWVSVVAALEVDGLFLRPIRVDSSGELTLLDNANNHANGAWGALNGLSNVYVAPYFVISLIWIVRQVIAYRRSSGERRQQLKALMSGGALCILGMFMALILGSGSGFAADAISDAGIMMVAALPLSIGVGILRYRLYEIDRLISRTLSYTILTGLLVGVFVGIVVFATDVLPFSSPIAVAASTLAAAALFNPLRLRVKLLVDRRFNRARYDAEATVAAFSTQLREAVDLNTVRFELVAVVEEAMQPAHASLWIRPPEFASRV